MKSMTAPRVLPISLLLVAPTGAPIAKSDEKSPSPRRDVPFAAAMVPLLLHHGSACGSRKSTHFRGAGFGTYPRSSSSIERFNAAPKSDLRNS